MQYCLGRMGACFSFFPFVVVVVVVVFVHLVFS
jgi:hypothetical protein